MTMNDIVTETVVQVYCLSLNIAMIISNHSTIIVAPLIFSSEVNISGIKQKIMRSFCYTLFHTVTQKNVDPF